MACISLDAAAQALQIPLELEAPQGVAIQQAETDPPRENFYKAPNVKLRITWTPERQRQLAEMWERGEKPPAIAAALGCKVGAVNVARARFGLKPRRVVSGRPKHEPDEPAHKIVRVAFTTSRLMEFCTEKELVAQTGHESYDWPRVIAKELVDNAIDAAEETEIAPVISIAIMIGKADTPIRIVIEDNGPGISPATIASVIDYNVRVSSREAYVSPTRGRQGNALKTILPMSYVLGGKVRGETWIETRGVKHRILFTVNQIKQEPIVSDIRARSPLTSGTRITVFWPSEIDVDEIAKLLREYIWVNPHLTLRFTVDGKTLFDHHATNPNWSKYRACDATSAHWYSLEQFERYAGALIDRDEREKRGTTVREFATQFRGMSSTEKQKQVMRELGASHLSLYRFFGSEAAVNHKRMRKLLSLLRQHTRPVRPELLGIIGEEHLRRQCIAAGGEEQAFKYFLSPGQDRDGVPYVVEIATCPYKTWVYGGRDPRCRELITGVNFSATIQNPFQSLRGLESMDEILTDLRAGNSAPIIVCVHYASPHIEYLDRGKSRIGLE
jgi:DNA topoisomerase VI subunit B